MENKHAPETVQEWCKPVQKMVQPHPKDTPLEPYTPYQELSSTPGMPIIAPAKDIGRALIEVTSTGIIAVLKAVTLGFLIVGEAADKRATLSAKRRQWQQYSREAAADNTACQQQQQAAHRQPKETIEVNVKITRK